MDRNLIALQELDTSDIATSLTCDISDLKNHIELNKNNFNVITQNIRSIYKNFDDFIVNLSQLTFDADILILTECRLKSSKQIPVINNYSMYHTLNQLNQNDGVIAYVNHSQKAHVTEIEFTHASGLQIITPKYIIIGIYRSPSNHNAEAFIESLNNHLDSISSVKNICIIGDININLIQTPEERSTERNNRLKYLDVLSCHGFLPGHYLPTRQGSCLDHVILKLDKTINSAIVAVLSATITDHQMVIFNVSNLSRITKQNCNQKNVINYDNAYKSLINKDVSSCPLVMTQTF